MSIYAFKYCSRLYRFRSAIHGFVISRIYYGPAPLCRVLFGYACIKR